MSDDSKNTLDDIEIDKGIIKIQENLGLQEEFFKKLLKENDWSFIIKLHALFENIINEFLVFHLNEPKLLKIISRLELSNKTTGKIAFLKELELINHEEVKYISKLAELRNILVHNIRNHNLNLNEMISDSDALKIKDLAISFSPYEAMARRIEKIEFFKSAPNPKFDKLISVENVIKRFNANPKEHIWFGAYNVLVSIVDKYSYSDYLQWEKANKLVDDDREYL